MSDNQLPPGVPPAGPAPAPVAPTVPVVPVVPTAPVVPAAAPVVPATEDNQKSDVSGNTPEIKTGNAALDAAIDLTIASTGASATDIDRLITKAMEFGSIELIDEAFALERFKDKAPQVIALAKAAVQESIAAVERNKQSVFQLAGGEQNWKNAVSIFNTNAPDHLKDAAKMLIDSGKVTEGAKLVMDTVINSGLVPNVNPTIGSGGAVVPSTAGALSAADFSKAMTDLKKEAGNRSLESGPFAERYNQLIQRRSLGRRAGL